MNNAFKYEVETPRLEPAVTLATVKTWLKVTTTSEDAIINTLIDAATTEFERYTNLILVTTEFKTYRNSSFCFELRRGNFQSLTTVKYLLDSVWTTFDFAANLVQTQQQPYALYVSKENSSDPIPDNQPANVEIVFKAGYGDSESDVPGSIQLLLMQMIAFFYENRGDCSAEALPEMIKNSLNNYKLRSIGG